MKKIFLLAAVATVPFAGPALAQSRPGPAVAIVVDTQRIFAECTACKAAQTQLQQQAQQLQQRAQQLGQPLQTEAQSIQQAAAALSGGRPDAALQQRITALEGKQTAAQQELQRSQQQFQRNQAYVVQQINARLNPIITQTMQTKNANIALDTQATLAIAPALDATNEVLAALNQQLPSVVVTAPAAPAQPQQPTGR